MLSDDKKRIEIAENGRKKTKEAHNMAKTSPEFCRFFIGNRIKNLLRDRRIMPILIIVFTERKSYRSGSVYHGRSINSPANAGFIYVMVVSATVRYGTSMSHISLPQTSVSVDSWVVKEKSKNYHN